MNNIKPTIIEVCNDDDSFSHYALVDSATGKKIWSANPVECKAQGYPVKDDPYEKINILQKQKRALEDSFSELKNKYEPSILPEHKSA